MTSSLPIACTLPAEAYAARLSWIADLNRSFLRGHRQNELVLELSYSSDATQLVQDLVERERECCAFLELTISKAADQILLRIEAPPNARTGASLLFEAFLEGASASTQTAAAPTASTVAPPRET